MGINAMSQHVIGSSRSTSEVFFQLDGVIEWGSVVRVIACSIAVIAILLRVFVYGDYRTGDLEKRDPPHYIDAVEECAKAADVQGEKDKCD